MKNVLILACMFISILTIALNVTAIDEKKDLATGEGLILLQSQSETSGGSNAKKYFRFEPRYGYAYKGETAGNKRMWLLMTAVDPAGIDWNSAKDRVQALRLWCNSKKTPFVLVELDSAGVPQLVTQCPGDGTLDVEMISTINGLPSVQVSYEINDGKRLRGHLQGGIGTCDEMTYCEQTKDYYFDVTLSR
jgi:hypothetical protein